LLMVHCKMLVPELSPVIALVGELLLLNTPEPESTDQVPMPFVIVFAARIVFGLMIHSDCVGPAFAMSGSASTLTLIVAEFEHPPFVICQRRTLIEPLASAETVVTASVGLAIVPEPVKIDQVPKPKVGVLALKAALGELAQTV